MERTLPVARAPWSERLIEKAHWSPVRLGGLSATALVLTFLGLSLFVGRLPLALAGDAALPVLEDIRIGVVLALLAAYLPAAWASAATRARRTLAELEPVLQGPGAEAAVRAAGRFDTATLRRAGWAGLATAVGIQLFTDWGESIVILGLPFETYWHRVMLGMITWFAARGVYATIVESLRFSRIGRDLVRIDLLDPTATAPLARWGLHSALLQIGALSLLSLLFYDLGAAPQLPVTLAVFVSGTLALAGVGLLLPLHGLRQAIQSSKRRELGWCHEQIRDARAAAARTSELSLADLVAYRGLVESVREWPLDAPTLRRFALYLVIPLVSWLGGALVERLVDSLAG
jgi:hypothetical protein